MSTATIVIFLLNLGSTFFMFGLIWFVQIVHYPLFARVGSEGFLEYQKRHQRQTTWVVAFPMVIEAFTAVLMIWNSPIADVPLLLIGVGLVFLIWMSTAFLQMPCHGDLERGFDLKAIKYLTLGNWVRTVAWTLRAALMGWVAFQVLTNNIN